MHAGYIGRRIKNVKYEAVRQEEKIPDQICEYIEGGNAEGWCDRRGQKRQGEMEEDDQFLQLLKGAVKKRKRIYNCMSTAVHLHSLSISLSILVLLLFNANIQSPN